MKLTKKQFCTCVNKYRDMLEQEQQIVDSLDIGEWVPSSWINSYYELLDELAELPEDYWFGNMLDWYCFETDFGRNEKENKIQRVDNGATVRINSPEALYDFIMKKE